MDLDADSEGSEQFDEANPQRQTFSMMKQLVKSTKATDRKIAAIQTDVTNIKQRQDGADAKMDDMQKQFDEKINALQKQVNDVASNGSAASTGFSSKGGGKGINSARLGLGFGAQRAWAASKIELKGWVINWKIAEKRTAEMLTPYDAEFLIHNAIQSLPEELKARIDEKASLEMMGSYTDQHGRQNSRSLISKVSLKTVSGTDSSQLWEMKRHFDPLVRQLPDGPLTENMTSKPLTMTGHNVRCVIESAPWQQPHIARIGQFKEMWKNRQKYENPNQIAQGVPEVRGKAGPPMTEIFTVVQNTQTRPVSLAEWTESGGWKLNNEGLLKVVPTLQVGNFKVDLEKLS